MGQFSVEIPTPPGSALNGNQQARKTLADGRARELIYGQGSPYVDIRLPCSGRLTINVERIAPDDATLAEVEAAAERRMPVHYYSDGERREAAFAESSAPWPIRRLYEPTQRLVVVGGDPFALAMAGLGRQIG